MRDLRIISVFLLLTLILACSAQQANESQTSAIQNVDSKEAANLITENPNLLIIDVRTPAEFNAGHIKEAKNINISDSDFQSQIEKLSRDSTYLVYCRTGNRSGRAINLMKQLNFKSIYHLQHGITEWVGEGKPVEK